MNRKIDSNCSKLKILNDPRSESMANAVVVACYNEGRSSVGSDGQKVHGDWPDTPIWDATSERRAFGTVT